MSESMGHWARRLARLGWLGWVGSAGLPGLAEWAGVARPGAPVGVDLVGGQEVDTPLALRLPKAAAKKLGDAGVETVDQLLGYAPMRYYHWGRLTSINSLAVGEHASPAVASGCSWGSPTASHGSPAPSSPRTPTCSATIAAF